MERLRQAVELSRMCPRSATAYSVGAVIVTREGDLFTGYSRETGPSNHAEEEAVAKALAAGANLEGAAIYTSMEPCTHRKSKPVSCTQLIIDNGFARVVFALPEPPFLAKCEGCTTLRDAGVEAAHLPGLEREVERINAHITAG